MSKKAKKTGLSDLRERIDQLDEEILDRLNERASRAVEVAEVKLRESDGEATVFYRPEREAQVLRRMRELNEGPLTDEKISRIYREVMSACLALEEPLKIAYLGPEGTFTQMATQEQFGDSVVGIPLVTVDDVFREVTSENCNYGVVPVENSSEGVISHTLDNFLSSNLRICGEVEIRVHHHLMTSSGSDSEIKRIYSHQQTLGQCRRWLNGHYPNVPQLTATSNAEAARRIAEEPDAAAIAGEIAADIYDLKIISRQIEDEHDNTTRFIVVGRDEVGPSGNDKTSIVVYTHNQPGALYKLLEPFHRHGVSLTSIETRPSRTGMWSYVFFIDFEGHHSDELIQTVLGEIDKDALEVKMLGSYPRALT
ncbi:MAG: prephenate dehydratase [Gammaproteobacteria bacterium]|jgi:chorismate mutase / prephenate dehydratase|nr:prephenate dehydratase [Gammaproteobacteria bacterium]MBT4493535.1 prephenate dehydratase [Gammaproteobacteria bacterium]MBT7370462.1 prephenate dehydratase [Gammaproteobacteria bacterium]